MEFIFTGKQAIGEFSVLQAPFDSPPRQDDDPNGNGRKSQEQANVNNNPSQHYDSDTLPDSNGPGSGDSKGKPNDY